MGIGVNWAIHGTYQMGLAFDDYGTTWFNMHTLLHVTNQDLTTEYNEEAQSFVGADIGLSVGRSVDFDSKSFEESVSSGSASIGAGFILGVSVGESSYTITAGVGASGSISYEKPKVDFSVSVTDSEASSLGIKAKIYGLGIDNVTAITENGVITGYSGTITVNKKNTGIKVNSEVKEIKNNSGVSYESNRIWETQQYTLDKNKQN